MLPKRIYLINRDFQLRYTLAAVVVGMISTSLTAFLLLYPLYKFEVLKITVFLPLTILGVIIAAAVANVIFIAVIGIFVTHKIAGPMYSLVRHFRRIEEGHWYGEMRLRDGDELRFVVRNFNAMIKSLQKQAQEDLNLVNGLSQDLNALEKPQSISLKVESLNNRLQTRLAPQGTPV